ncbi:MAG: LCP family protein [Parcubacteria group bacterium]|nr:LCP family protein [Parcubacteria group bacterium]
MPKIVKLGETKEESINKKESSSNKPIVKKSTSSKDVANKEKKKPEKKKPSSAKATAGKKKRIFLKIILPLIIIIPILLFGIVYLLAPDRYNILIVGCDRRGEERARSDVMMVFSIPKSPKEQTSLITIPRDSRVDIPGHGMDKMTHAYIYEDLTDASSIGNIELTQETIEKFLDIKINGTVEFTFESFKDVVDLVGGVWTDDGYYDGEKALAMVRNRYRAGGDFARTDDQRKVFRAVMTQMKDRETATEVYDYLKESDSAEINIDFTRLGMFGATTFVRRLGKLSLGDIKTDFIPGQGQTLYAENFGQNLYFWVIDEEEKEKMVEEYLK